MEVTLLSLTPVDTPVRLLVVDPSAADLASMASLAEVEGIDVRTAVDASGAVEQCRHGYLDLVMIDAGADGSRLLQAIRTQRPTVHAVLMSGPGARVARPSRDEDLACFDKPVGLGPLRQLVRELRNRPRHVPNDLNDGSEGFLHSSLKLDELKHRGRH
jgi:DNA-binding NtrC family response regulator